MGSGLTHAVRGGIDPGHHRYSSRVVGAVEIRRVSEPGMGPYLSRVRRNCPLLVGEPLSSSEGGAALWSSNQSAIIANGVGASTPLGAVTTGQKSVLFPGLSNCYVYRMASGPGMGPYRPRVELALKYTTPSQSYIGRSVGLGISTMCGEISILVIHPCLFPGCPSCIMYV